MVAVADIIPYENNPRRNADAVQPVAESIKRYGFKVPMILDAENVIVAGHTRYEAAQVLGLTEVPVIYANDLTEEQIREFRLVDNKTAEFAEWDFSKLEEELEGLDFGGFDFGFGTDDDEIGVVDIEENHAGNLQKNFIVPPFSVLDTRQGYWQDRKREWLELTGDLSETRDGEFGRLRGGGVIREINEGTSNFDPVLAEVMYKWFNVQGGKILDPFGGEQTKGVVAGECGYTYHACEFRAEQVALNKEKTAKYDGVHYYQGDSNNIDQIIGERGFDMLFTSPPYYDLEVYSKEDMSALGTYEEFMSQYRNIFTKCYDMLADDAFAVVKVAEIRDKKTGAYRCFVADNIKMFCDIGFTFYNDIVLVNAVGTGAIRANTNMRTRKVVKLHQNVLVFYKGNLENIAGRYPMLNFEESDYEQ